MKKGLYSFLNLPFKYTAPPLVLATFLFFNKLSHYLNKEQEFKDRIKLVFSDYDDKNGNKQIFI